MKIRDVSIKGFQSHVDSTFTLSDGLTVITGPSDAGKTAIVRALRWLAFNEPQGEAFLHTIRNEDGSIKKAVDSASVSVTFDNGITVTKTRRKGKTTYTHSSYQEPWEKAELPPEIKEALGLVKQEYGDFTTCLNFAFQLEAPFLLSETASVGAKVLGKIAGTEIVDKANAEVNKRTHKTRLDISQAEKLIGQLDVELLEYLTLEDMENAYLKAKAAYEETKKELESLDILKSLYATFLTKHEALLSAWDKLNPLEVVTLLKPRLQGVEAYHIKAVDLRKVADAYKEAYVSHVQARRKLLQIGSLEGLSLKINGVERLQDTLTALRTHSTSYDSLKVATNAMVDVIKQTEAITSQKQAVEQVSKDYEALTALKGLLCAHSTTIQETERLNGRVGSLEKTIALKGKYEAVEGILQTLEALNELYSLYFNTRNAFGLSKVELEIAEKEVQRCKDELEKAWEEAGGVCPLCGKEIDKCTH